MKKTLHLNLRKQWFDKIEKEIKSEEYREIKEYWIKRLLSFCCDTSNWCGEVYDEMNDEAQSEFYIPETYQKFYGFNFKEFDTITFSNGMTHPIPRIVVELKEIKIAEGKEEWGAEAGVKYFVLMLGKILKRENIK